uniref:Chromosome 3 open reading frame 14 n=1 Tax=Falco tinnunculus TaxID=100819 RepID=A0A8C4V3Y9_FALTI
MSSGLAQEVHLARRHREILSQRSELLQQMETYLGDKKTKKTWQTQAADAAHKRNAALLNDIEAAEKKLQERVYLLPDPDTLKLELEESEPEPILVCLSTGMVTNGVIPARLYAPKTLPACKEWRETSLVESSSWCETRLAQEVVEELAECTSCPKSTRLGGKRLLCSGVKDISSSAPL